MENNNTVLAIQVHRGAIKLIEMGAVSPGQAGFDDAIAASIKMMKDFFTDYHNSQNTTLDD